jgi:hypothetical protein
LKNQALVGSIPTSPSNVKENKMLKVTMIFDNKIATDMTLKEFVENYYLDVSERGEKDLVSFTVEQGDYEN